MFRVTKLMWLKGQKDASAPELSLTTWPRQSPLACTYWSMPPLWSRSIIHASSNSWPCIQSDQSHRATAARLDGKRLNAVAQANIEMFRETKAKSHGSVALVTKAKQKNHLLLVGTPLTQLDKFWTNNKSFQAKPVVSGADHKPAQPGEIHMTPWWSRGRGAGSPGCSRGSSAWCVIH